MFIREIKYSYGKATKIETQEQITEPKLVYEFFNKTVQCPIKENFIVIFLDNKNNPLGWDLVSLGTANEAIVHPRDVFRAAILLNATAIIVAHNHPSGEVEPSKEDKATTTRLKECGKIVGIQLLDHIIVGHGQYYSFEENEKWIEN